MIDDDTRLITDAKAGDVSAFGCLAAEHHEALARFCRRLMGDAAAGEDLQQETLLRAQLSIRRLGEPYRFGPWLFGIAANLAKKAWRREARRPLSLDALAAAFPNVEWHEWDVAVSVASPEQVSEEAEETRLLLEAIRALPESLTQVVVLHYLNGLDYAAVANALAVPVSTVKGRLFASRERLRHHLAAAGVRNGALPPRRATTRARKPHSKGATPTMTGSTPNRPVHGPDRTIRPARDTRVVPFPVETQGDDRASRNLRVEVRLGPLVDEAMRFINDPWPRSYPLDSLGDLATTRNRYVPIHILEQMVLSGVSKRADVEAFIRACFSSDQFEVIES